MYKTLILYYIQCFRGILIQIPPILLCIIFVVFVFEILYNEIILYYHKKLLDNHEYYSITSLHLEYNVFSGLQPRQSVGVFCGIRHQSYWISFIAMFKLRIVYQRHLFQRLCIFQRTKSPIHGIGS